MLALVSMHLPLPNPTEIIFTWLTSRLVTWLPWRSWTLSLDALSTTLVPAMDPLLLTWSRLSARLWVATCLTRFALVVLVMWPTSLPILARLIMSWTGRLRSHWRKCARACGLGKARTLPASRIAILTLLPNPSLPRSRALLCPLDLSSSSFNFFLTNVVLPCFR